MKNLSSSPRKIIYMVKEILNFECLENENNFLGEMKSILHNF